MGDRELDETVLAEFCLKWGIAELAVFGSALRQDFTPESDIDFLVTWLPGAQPHLFRMLDMKDELAGLVGRGIDLVQRHLVERDRNPYRRRAILGTAQTLYAAA